MLIDEHYVGHRPQLWEEQTSITFTPPKNPPENFSMPNNPIFQPLDPVAPSREQLVTAISGGRVHVIFEAADGSVKDMICTTNEALIPVDKRPKPTTSLREVAFTPNLAVSKKQEDPNLIRVFAVDRDAWRSFRVERVIRFTPVS